MTINKRTKGNYHVRNDSKVVLSLAEHQHNCTYSLGYKLTLQRESDNHVICHPAEANDAANLALAGRVILYDISLSFPHHTPNMSNQKLMLRHFVTRTATELTYIERSSYTKDATSENT